MPCPIRKPIAVAVGALTVAAATVVPAAATGQNAGDTRGTTACAALTGELKTEADNALKALTAGTPDPGSATKALWTVLTTTDALRAAKCLPAIPPTDQADQTDQADPTKCLASALELISQLTAVLAALVPATGGTVPPGLVPTAEKLVGTVTSLIDAQCLPAPS